MLPHQRLQKLVESEFSEETASKAVEILTEFQINPEAGGNLVLSVALEKQCLKWINLLLKHRVDIEVKDVIIENPSNLPTQDPKYYVFQQSTKSFKTFFIFKSEYIFDEDLTVKKEELLAKFKLIQVENVAEIENLIAFVCNQSLSGSGKNILRVLIDDENSDILSENSLQVLKDKFHLESSLKICIENKSKTSFYLKKSNERAINLVDKVSNNALAEDLASVLIKFKVIHDGTFVEMLNFSNQLEEFSEPIKYFEDVKKLEKSVKENNIHGCKKFILKYPNEKRVLNSNSESILCVALTLRKYEAFCFLIFHDFVQEQEEKQILKDLSESERDLLTDAEHLYLKGQTKDYFYNLNSNTTDVGKENSTEKEKREYRRSREKAFRDLDLIPEMRAIMKIVSPFRIVFDFTQSFVRNKNSRLFGSTFSEHESIKFYAQQLLSNDEVEFQNGKAVLGHEMTHLAIKIMFENNFEPYFKFEKQKKKQFLEIVEGYKKGFTDSLGKIINDVFEDYDEDDWPSELIVAVSEFLILNHKNLSELKKLKATELYKFYDEMINFFIADYPFCLIRKKVSRLNDQYGLSESIRKMGLSSKKNLSHGYKEIFASRKIFKGGKKVLIFETNCSDLMLCEVHRKLEKFYVHFNSFCVFSSLSSLENKDFNSYLLLVSKQLVRNDQLPVFVIQCSKNDRMDISERNLSNLINATSKIVLIVENVENLQNLKLKSFKLTKVSWAWGDLSDSSQKLLETQNKINLIQPSKFYIKRKFKSETLNELDLKSVLKIAQEEHTIVLHDDPGMGKSIVLSRIASKLKTPDNFVVFIELKNYTTFLESQINDNEKSLVPFLRDEILKLKSVASELFQLSYNQKKVFLLFDGLDEVSSNCYHYIVRLIIEAQESGIQSWITTRSHLIDKLRSELNPFVLRLLPFSEADTIEFIKESLKIQDTSKDEILKTNLQKISTKIHEFVNFVQVPLYLRMTVEILGMKIVQDQLNVEELVTNFYKFYETYMSKHMTRWLEKGEHAYEALHKINSMSLTPMKILQLQAIHSLFDEEFVKSSEMSKIQNLFREELKLTGILRNDGTKNLQFIHESFKDFFAVNFIISNTCLSLYYNQIEAEKSFRMIIKIMTERRYVLLRKLLDEALKSVGTDRFKKNQNIKSFNELFVEAIKKTGKTVFHYIAAEGCFSTIELANLLISDEEVFAETWCRVDDFGSNCFMYMVEKKSSKPSIQLVWNETKRNCVNQKSFFLHQKMGQTLISLCVYSGDEETFRFFYDLMKSFFERVEIEDLFHGKASPNVSIWYEAIENCSIYVVKSVWFSCKLILVTERPTIIKELTKVFNIAAVKSKSREVIEFLLSQALKRCSKSDLCKILYYKEINHDETIFESACYRSQSLDVIKGLYYFKHFTVFETKKVLEILDFSKIENEAISLFLKTKMKNFGLKFNGNSRTSENLAQNFKKDVNSLMNDFWHFTDINSIEQSQNILIKLCDSEETTIKNIWEEILLKMSKSEINTLLTKPNRRGQTPLYLVLETKNFFCFKNFINLVQDELVLTPNELEFLIKEKDKINNSSLKLALFKNGPDVVKLFLNFVKESFKDKQKLEIYLQNEMKSMRDLMSSDYKPEKSESLEIFRDFLNDNFNDNENQHLYENFQGRSGPDCFREPTGRVYSGLFDIFLQFISHFHIQFRAISSKVKVQNAEVRKSKSNSISTKQKQNKNHRKEFGRLQ